MAWKGARQLVLPAALTVTTFAAVGVVVSCGGDDDSSGKSSQAVAACADKPSDACEKCKDDKGKVTCGPKQDCYPTASGGCQDGNSS